MTTNNKAIKKATLEELLRRKEQGAAERMQTKEIDVPSIGLTFTVLRQPLTRVLKLMDQYKGVDSLSSQFEMYKELIYISTPLFQSQELQAEYGCVEPYDIVPAILEENLTAITEFGEGISDLYGLANSGGPVEELKN